MSQEQKAPEKELNPVDTTEKKDKDEPVQEQRIGDDPPSRTKT